MAIFKHSNCTLNFISYLMYSTVTQKTFTLIAISMVLILISTDCVITQSYPQHDCDCGIKISPHARVYGGSETGLNQYPWMAHLRFYPDKKSKKFYYCGGSLIDDQHVMTAAHCVHSPKKKVYPFDQVKVYLGLHDLRNLTNPIEIEEYFYPTAYDSSYPVEFDFAIIRLKRKVHFSDKIYPICLLENNANINLDNLIVAGWGHSTRERKKVNPKLLHARVRFIPNDECDAMRKEYLLENHPEYRKHINKNRLTSVHFNHMCALDTKKNADACQGDSGGPLMTINPNNGRYYLVGVVSGGYNECGAPKSPTLYTVVSNFNHITETHVRDAQICEF